MRKSIFFFIKLGILVAAAVWLAQQPGRMTVEWLGYVIDLPVALAFAIMLLIMGVVALLYRFWRALRGGPQAMGRRRDARKREQGYRALTQGMVAVAAGDAEAAKRYAAKAESLLDEPPLTLLLSAQAAQLQGDDGAAATYFKAMLSRKETELLGLRGLLNQAMRRGDRAAALEHARRAQALYPKAQWPAAALAELEAASGNWLEADSALARAQKTKALDKDTTRHRRAALLIEESRSAAAAGRPEAALQAAQSAFDLDPARVPAATQLARLRAASGQHGKATKVLEQAWRLAPHPDLAAAWGETSAKQQPLDLVKRYEALVALSPESADAHRGLAAAAIKARLWGVARSHLDQAMVTSPTVATYRLLADLARAEHGAGPQASDWLARVATADPDPTWICGNCGVTHEQWHAVCSACGTFDSVAWRKPGAALPAAVSSL